MSELIALAVVVSLDNVRLAGALGLLATSSRRWWQLALLMAVCESVFPILGATFAPDWLAQRAANFEVLGPATLVLASALTLAGLFWARPVRAGWLLYALPFLFGLDNMVAGVGLGLPGVEGLTASLLVGLTSGAVSLATMTAVGLFAGRLGPRFYPASAVVALLLGLSLIILP